MRTSGLSSVPEGGLTSLLESSLDIIGREINESRTSDFLPFSSSGSPERTAASLLLEERKRSQQALDVTQSFAFQPVKQQSLTGTTPQFEQISSSQVVSKNAYLHKKTKQTAVKSSSSKASHGKMRGEDYTSRFKEKLAGKAMKAKLKNKLKSS